MRIKSHIGVTSRPGDTSSAIRVVNAHSYGSLRQQFDKATNEYSPDRQISGMETVLELAVWNSNNAMAQDAAAVAAGRTVVSEQRFYALSHYADRQQALANIWNPCQWEVDYDEHIEPNTSQWMWAYANWWLGETMLAVTTDNWLDGDGDMKYRGQTYPDGHSCPATEHTQPPAYYRADGNTDRTPHGAQNRWEWLHVEYADGTSDDIYTLVETGRGLPSDVDWTDTERNTLIWKWRYKGQAAYTAVTSEQSKPLYVNTLRQLVVALNLSPSYPEAEIVAMGTYRDALGMAHEVEETVRLTLNTSSSLFLRLDRVLPLLPSGTPDGSYAGELAVVNVLRLAEKDTTGVWRIDKAVEWTRKCAAQLYNGGAVLPDAYPSANSDTRGGTAFYFWHTLDSHGRLTQLDGTEVWAGLSVHGDGSHHKELTVDMRLTDSLQVVCRAAVIPYGEYQDYIVGGKLDTSRLWAAGYQEAVYRLRVEWPEVTRVDVASLSYDHVDRERLADGTLAVRRRALVTCGNRTVADPALRDDPGTPTAADKLFNIEWLVQSRTGTVRSLGKSGEFLTATLAELGVTAASADAMPSLLCDVTVRHSWNDGEVQIAHGVTVTGNPQPGDALYIDGTGGKVWLKNDTDQLDRDNIPAGLTPVGAVIMRNGRKVTVADKEDGDAATHFCAAASYLLRFFTVDGTAQVLSFTVRVSTDYSQDHTITVMHSAGTVMELLSAIRQAIARDKAAHGWTDTLLAYRTLTDGSAVKDTVESGLYIGLCFPQAGSVEQLVRFSATGASAQILTWTPLADGSYTSDDSYPFRRNGTQGGNDSGVLNAARAAEFYKANAGRCRTPSAMVPVMDAQSRPVTYEAFTGPFGAKLIAAYGSGDAGYRAYIAAEYMISDDTPANGAFNDKAAWLTRTFGPLTVPTTESVTAKIPVFPALNDAFAKGYASDGLGRGKWFVAGGREVRAMLDDDFLPRLNGTLSKMGGDTVSGSSRRWMVQRRSETSMWYYNEAAGYLGGYSLLGTARWRACVEVSV